jgi:hypothetical protein
MVKKKIGFTWINFEWNVESGVIRKIKKNRIIEKLNFNARPIKKNLNFWNRFYK